MTDINPQGDFDTFVAQRGGRLWRAAWLLTSDAQHAEDLVQTALIKTYGRYRGFNDDDHYEAYVRTTMHRTFCSWWRRRRWRSEIPSTDVPDGAYREDSPALRVDVARALNELPRMQRSVMVLRHFEDKTVDQVAEILGISPGTVKSHAHRAAQTLRSTLATPSEATT